MGQEEGDLIKQIRIEASRRGDRLWRVNVGTAWNGRIGWVQPQNIKPRPLPGAVKVLTDLRLFQTGLPKGFPDTVGFKIDRPSRLPVFSLCEVKTKKLKLSKEQKLFRENMQNFGVNYSLAYSLENFVLDFYGENN